MRSQHCALRGAQCETFGAPGMTRRTAIVRYPGLGSWPLALSRVVRDHNPERQLQPDPRPVYLIEINVLQFPFHGGRSGRVFAARFDRCLLYSPQSVHVAFMSP
jgi:hypothetical protein